MNTKLQNLFLALALLASGNVARSASITWTNIAGGDWGVAANWSPNQVPGSSDSAFITNNGSYTVTINSLTVGNVLLGGGSGQQILNFNNGTLPGGNTLTVATNATLLVGSPVNFDGVVTNAGTVTWLEGVGGSLNLGAAFYNLAGAVFNIEGYEQSINNDGGGVFNNAGLVSVDLEPGVGSFTLNVNVPFNNNGTLDVQSGTLILNNGGSYSGLYSVESGGTLVFNTASTLAGDGQISGPGSVQINSGFQLNGSLTATNVVIQNGSFTNNGTLGSLNLTLTGETLTGSSSNWVDNGTWSWNGSTLPGGNTLTVATNATLLVGSPVNFDGVVTNAGTVTWLEGVGGSLNLGAAFYNLAGAVFNIEGYEQSINNDGGGVFNNAGLVSVDLEPGVGSFTLNVNVPFNNNGTLDVQSGTLILNNGGSYSGLYSVESGGKLVFNTASTLAGDGQISGPGSVQINSGFQLNGSLNATNVVIQNGSFTNNGTLGSLNLTLTGETLTGSSSNWVDNGTWSWNSSTLPGGNTLTVATNATLLVVGSPVNFDGVVTNSGTVTWPEGNGNLNLGATFYNLAGAVFNIEGYNQSINNDGGGVFNNAGLVSVDLETAFGPVTLNVNIPFNNSGTLDVQSETLILNNGGSYSGLYSVESGGKLVFNTASTLAGDGQISGPGSVQINSGFQLNGSLNATNVVIQNGSFTNNGTLGSLNLTLTGETLTGSSSNWVDNGTWSWNSSTLPGGNTLTVATNATLLVVGSPVNFDGVVTNSGTVTWPEGNGNLNLGATFYNLAGAVFNIEGYNQSINNDGGGVFNNAGLVSVDLETAFGPVTLNVNIPFNNSGTLDVQSETLILNNGGSYSGLYSVESGGKLVFNTASTLAGDGQISGPGSVQINSGFQLNGSLNATNVVIQNGSFTNNGTLGSLNLTLTGETLTGSSSNWVDNGTWSWNSSTLPGGNTLTVATNATLLVVGSPVNFDGVVTNSGTVTWPEGNGNLNLGATFYNLAGAVFNIESFPGNSINNDGGGVINNAGLVSVDLDTGFSAFTINVNVPFNNSGTLDVQSGMLQFNGSYTETSSASQVIGIGGTLPPSSFYGQYGQIQFSSTPTFAGSFNVTLLNGFRPSPGNSFSVLSYPSLAGDFTSLNGLDLGSGLELVPQFGSTGLTLVATAYAVNAQPSLSLYLTPGGTLVSWPLDFTGWQLQTTTNLATHVWTSVTVNGTNNNVILPQTGSQGFFRLKNN